MTTHLAPAISRIRRSPYKTAAAVSIMTMTLFLASVFIILAAGSQVLLKYFETRPQINAFFASDYVPPAQEIDKITTRLQATNLVDQVKYISKEDALAIYKDLNQSDPLLLEAVTAGMLPASLEVSAKAPSHLRSLADQLSREEHIDDVRFAEDIVNSLTTWTRSIRIVGGSLVGVHVLITFTVILLIIGIKVSERRGGISLLQLIGASPGFVAAPFVWEGLLYGIFGAGCAWLVTVIILLYSMPFLVTFLAGVPLLPPPWWFFPGLLGTEILLGIILGGLGGLLAVRRFLKS